MGWNRRRGVIDSGSGGGGGEVAEREAEEGGSDFTR